MATWTSRYLESQSPSENKGTLAGRGQRTRQLNGLASIGTPSLVTRCVVQTKARAKHSPFAKNPDLAIIGDRISGLTKILAKDFQLLGKINK